MWAVLIIALLSIAHAQIVIHEVRSENSLWEKLERVDPDLLLRMRVGLKQQNLDRGQDILLDVSKPDSSNYAKYYTPEQVAELFSPTQKSIHQTRNWLSSAQVNTSSIGHSANRGWLVFDIKAGHAESLLHAKYYYFRHIKTDKRAIACDQYSLPRHVQPHVDYITPGVVLSLARSLPGNVSPSHRPPNSGHVVTDTRDTPCWKLMTPDCIAQLYRIPSTTYKQANPNNSLGLFEWEIWFNQTSLNDFYKDFDNSTPNGTQPKLQLIDTPYVKDPQYTLEADLDVEKAYPIIYPQTITIFQTDDAYYFNHRARANKAGVFNTFLDAIDGTYCTYSAYGETGNDPKIDPHYPNPGFPYKPECGIYKPTNVISVSYFDYESFMPVSYQHRQCSEWMKLGLQGHTLVFASGDSGVQVNPTCIGPGHAFNLQSPVGCPYVTTVGVTELPRGASVNEPEVAAGKNFSNFVASGGGFSNIFKRPSYQDDALKAYFADHNPPYAYYETQNGTVPPKGRYNRIGRGFPDLSANGVHSATYDVSFGGIYAADGSSASAPIVAAIFNRVNEERLASGKATIGFVNPALYARPDLFNDITSGNNPGCGVDGFEAVAGWDPVTGLGTPDFEKLSAYLSGLQ